MQKAQVDKPKQQTLLKSLAEFQYECPIIHKDTSGFNYTYADLPKIISTIMPIMKKHKLCFSQPLEGTQLRTIIYHTETGESIESITDIPIIELAKMNVYQSFGSGITYFRRYALSSILGLVTDKDIDAAGEQVKVVDKPKTKLHDLSIIQIPTMNDVAMLKLVARYNGGETDVFDKAVEHFTFREKDLLTIKALQNDRNI
jgi:hypothetical protein